MAEERVGLLWYIWHDKIAEASSQDFEDMGAELVGLYSSEQDARRAMDLLRDRPGFRDWPGGFRLSFGGLDGRPAFAEGFVDGYDDPD